MGALLRTGTRREGQQRVEYDAFATPPMIGRFLRVPAVHVFNRSRNPDAPDTGPLTMGFRATTSKCRGRPVRVARLSSPPPPPCSRNMIAIALRNCSLLSPDRTEVPSPG